MVSTTPERIIAGAAYQFIIASCTICAPRDIVPCPVIISVPNIYDKVVAGTPVQRVITGMTRKRVVAGTTQDNVAASATSDTFTVSPTGAAAMATYTASVAGATGATGGAQHLQRHVRRDRDSEAEPLEQQRADGVPGVAGRLEAADG